MRNLNKIRETNGGKIKEQVWQQTRIDFRLGTFLRWIQDHESLAYELISNYQKAFFRARWNGIG